MKIIVAVSGASGAKLAQRLIEAVPKEHEVGLIVSEGAKIVLEKELKCYEDEQIWAAPASGSAGFDAMMVVPCSVNTLAKISCGIADNLTTRAASVIIKERKTLLLAVRENPLSPIALENMLKLSRLGVIIAPPMLGYYAKTQTLEQMEEYLVGRWLDMIGIKNDLYIRWGDEEV